MLRWSLHAAVVHPSARPRARPTHARTQTWRTHCVASEITNTWAPSSTTNRHAKWRIAGRANEYSNLWVKQLAPKACACAARWRSTSVSGRLPFWGCAGTQMRGTAGGLGDRRHRLGNAAPKAHSWPRCAPRALQSARACPLLPARAVGTRTNDAPSVGKTCVCYKSIPTDEPRPGEPEKSRA